MDAHINKEVIKAKKNLPKKMTAEGIMMVAKYMASTVTEQIESVKEDMTRVTTTETLPTKR